ncbi:MAG: hypothetical protein GKR87_04890 [Kiritimatiellae bacterium]|nr:hypothetical protein [Kiritimatiellia bacterium]
MRIVKRFHNLRKQGLRHILQDKIWGTLFDVFEKFGIHILPVHYYTPIPDTRELRKTLKNWYKKSPMQGVNLNEGSQLDLLNAFSSYSHQLEQLPDFGEMQNAGMGPGYGEIEAHVLSAMIYHLQPEMVIEVGSGVSSLYSLAALEANQRGKLLCIEPYPSAGLKNVDNSRVSLIEKKVQKVSLQEFRVLQDNDILFIDSSHISKLASDVNYLFLEVLPILKKGVVIHIHDTSLPYPCSQKSVFTKL